MHNMQKPTQTKAECGDDEEVFGSLPPGLRWASWDEWQATTLNRLFLQQGVRGEPGRITAATVRHGRLQEARASDQPHEQKEDVDA